MRTRSGFRSTRRGIVHELGVAGARGDRDGLRDLLDPAVAVVVSRGDAGAAETRVVHGAEDASLLLAHGLAAGPGAVIEERPVNSRAGLLISRAGRTLAAVAVDVSASAISVVWVRLDPPPQRRGHTVIPD